jgi:tripartite-type tricarboxylate transporter receptor subunit TctC
LPDLPTIADTVPGYEVVLWFGTMAPKGTPPAVMERLNGAINKALGDPAVKKVLDKDGMIGSGGTPQQFDTRIRQDYERWDKVVKERGIKPE